MLDERMISFRGCLITFLVLLVLMGLGSSASAQTRPPALQKLVEEAKKEGTLKLQWLGGRLDGDGRHGSGLNKMCRTNQKAPIRLARLPYELNKITQEKAGRPVGSNMLDDLKPRG
jgi:hypothetical protein